MILKLSLRENKINSKGLAPLVVWYSLNTKTTYLSTGISVKPQHWFERKDRYGKIVERYIDSTKEINKNKANQELIVKAQLSDREKNRLAKQKLKEIESVVDKYHYENGLYPDFKTLRELLTNEKPQKLSKKEELYLLQEFEKFRLDIRDDLENNTWRHYKVTYNHLKSYLKKDILLNDLDLKKLQGFRKYLQRSKKLSAATVKKNFDRLKRFLNFMNKNGYYHKIDFKDVEIPKEDYSQNDIIFLTLEELKKLTELKLSKFSRLDKVRDVFLMSCSTGLRFSDIMRLQKERIRNDKIYIRTKKNKKRLEIPLFLYSRSIFEKYDFNIPKISNQRMNEYLKELLSKAKINEKIVIDSWKGQKVDKVFEKYELVSSHTGKKTYIMMHIENGTPIHVLSELTGNTMDTLKHYYRITDDIKRKYCNQIEEKAGFTGSFMKDN